MKKELKQAYIETIIAFSEALEARDKYTAGHSHRVMEYSVAIGQRMKLTETGIEQLKIVALLHDIGKIGISDIILTKQSKLSEKEFAVLKTHPVIGVNILKSVKLLDRLVPAIYHHHERFDGKGYPHGIKGNKIPLFARIIAVADSFDAMTSNRPYRRALSIQIALSELERNKGTQFDPDIVDIFIRILKYSPFYFAVNRESEYYL